MNIFTGLAAVCGASLALRMALLPPPPRVLWYKGKHALHGGLVPSDVLAHLCDIESILKNEPHDPSCDSAFQRLLGKIRAVYMAIHLGESHAVVKTICVETREELSKFEAYIARSSFIQDIGLSLRFIADEITDASLLKIRPSTSTRPKGTTTSVR